MASSPDPKPARRVKDPGLMRLMHLTPGPCALADENCEPSLNLHHVYPRSQGGDDVRANLVWLCGSGTTGHHGKIHRRDLAACCNLREHLLMHRTDFLRYLADRVGEGPALWWIEDLCR